MAGDAFSISTGRHIRLPIGLSNSGRHCPFPYRYVLFDHDAKFGNDVFELLRASGIRPLRTSVRSPWQNGIAERWVGSVRREMLDHVIPLNERRYIQTLTESCCRWPIGDPQQPDFHFCGKKKIPGLPYCEVHARRAFQPPQARRRERDFVPMVALPRVSPMSEVDMSEPDLPQPSDEKAAV